MGKIKKTTREEIAKKNKTTFLDPSIVFGGKFAPDLDRLKKSINHCKGLGLRIVLTQGTWDLVHIGHARYFAEAKKHGDLLVVGVDSDEKVRARKGPDRPIVPQEERMEMVTHLKHVDLVVLKEHKASKWHLIKLVRPDVLIATKETYDSKQIKDLKKYCGKIVVLEPRATTSTSAKIRRLQISTAKKLEKALTPRLIETIQDVLSELKTSSK
jgi:D-glycero-beta-D-manno-heptose 1-phosphate adenylyltransferase